MLTYAFLQFAGHYKQVHTLRKRGNLPSVRKACENTLTCKHKLKMEYSIKSESQSIFFGQSTTNRHKFILIFHCYSVHGGKISTLTQ
jgi:hypothetical protein